MHVPDSVAVGQQFDGMFGKWTLDEQDRLEVLSYRHVWGLLRSAEQLFGTPLLEKRPGRA